MALRASDTIFTHSWLQSLKILKALIGFLHFCVYAIAFANFIFQQKKISFEQHDTISLESVGSENNEWQ